MDMDDNGITDLKKVSDQKKDELIRLAYNNNLDTMDFFTEAIRRINEINKRIMGEMDADVVLNDIGRVVTFSASDGIMI